MPDPRSTAQSAARSAAASAQSAAASATHAANLIQGPIDEALLGPINTAVAEAQAARDEAVDISGLSTSDAVIANRIETPGTATQTALSATIAAGVTAAFNPADPGYDVILVAGQSNAAGSGVGVDDMYDYADPRVQQFPATGTYASRIVKAVDPLVGPQGAYANKVGFAMTFAKEYVRTIPANRKVLIVPTAVGSTGFAAGANGSWDPTGAAGGTNLYLQAIAKANAAIAAHPNNRLAAILWHQGEAGTYDYDDALDALIAGFRANIVTATATTPVVVGQIADTYWPLYSVSQHVNSAHADTPVRLTRTAFAPSPSALVDPTMVEADKIHFSAKGARAIGQSMWLAYQRALANVTGQAPLPPSAITFGLNLSDSDQVIVTWTPPVGRYTWFRVEYQINGGAWTNLAGTGPAPRATFDGRAEGDTLRVRVATNNEQGQSAWATSDLYTVPAPPIPNLNMQVDHYWHPRSYTAGTAWVDEISGISLPIQGTAADLTKSTVDGREVVHTKSTAAFANNSVATAEIRTVIVIAKPLTGDVETGFSYPLNIGQAAIGQAVSSDNASTVPTTANLVATRGLWHIYAISAPASRLFGYVVDGNTQTLGVAAGGDNTALRVGASASQRRELRVAAVISSTQVYTPAQIVSDIVPAIKAAWSDLTFA